MVTLPKGCREAFAQTRKHHIHMTRMKTYFTPSIRRRILACAFLGLTALTSHAASIIWGSAQNITGDTDVSTAGTLLGAANLTSLSGTTVNGVTFPSWDPSGPLFLTSGVFSVGSPVSTLSNLGSGSPLNTLSTSYQNLVTSGAVFNGPTLTISGLITGSTYQFQWWADVSSASTGTATATAGNSRTLSYNATGLNGGLGQFAIGTFIADSATQGISFSGTGAFGSAAFVNGVQVRLTVPEPSSAAMLALGVCLSGMAGRSRRQTAAA